MQVVNVLSLLLIALTWLCALRAGYRLSLRCGVNESASAWALACIPPTAGLVCAVHVVMTLSFVTGAAVVTPVPIAVAFGVLGWIGSRVVGRLGGDAQNPSAVKEPPSAEPRMGWLWLPVLCVAGMYAVFFVDAVTRYPTGYDGLHYHLPTAVGWMRTARMDLSLGLLHQSFPENGMIVPFLLAFSKSDRLLTLVHLPKALWVALSIFGLARAVGVGNRAALLGACIALSVPIVVFQSFSSYIDLYAASAWLAALLALTWVARTSDARQRRMLIVLAGLSAGVALGSKTTFLVLVPLLGVVAIAAARMSSKDAVRPGSSPVRAALWFGVACLACSFGWFTRGAIQAGNPVYPLAVEVGGERLLPGVAAREHFPSRPIVRKLARWWDYPWRETKHSGTGYPYSVNNAMGAAYAAFVPVGFVAALWGFITRRERTVERAWMLIYAALSLTGMILLLTLFREMLRFVLPLGLIGAVFGAWLVQRMVDRHPRVVPVLATVAFAVTAAVAVLKPAHALAGRIRGDVWSRAEFYEMPAEVDDLSTGARILNLAELPATYPLYGEDLDREVITALQWEAMLSGRAMSARSLREHGIEYIYLRGPCPNDWPRDLPVTLLGGDGDGPSPRSCVEGRIYRVAESDRRVVHLSAAPQAGPLSNDR